MVKPDISWDGITIPLAGGSIDCALVTEVLEQCPEPKFILAETWRVFKTGGLLFMTVPFLWLLHDLPHDEYRSTPCALKRHLQGTGFTEMQLKALGRWHASLAQALGLWIQRSYPPYVSSLKRPRCQRGVVRTFYLSGLWFRQYILGIILMPIVKYRADHDTPPTKFYKGNMITDLLGTAIKPTSSNSPQPVFPI